MVYLIDFGLSRDVSSNSGGGQVAAVGAGTEGKGKEDSKGRAEQSTVITTSASGTSDRSRPLQAQSQPQSPLTNTQHIQPPLQLSQLPHSQQQQQQQQQPALHMYGTLNFASSRSLRGAEPVFRDDLEGLAFSLLYLLQGTYVWCIYVVYLDVWFTCVLCVYDSTVWMCIHRLYSALHIHLALT